MGPRQVHHHLVDNPPCPLHLRLALKSILEGSFGELLVTLGVCCSSWVATSRGSTKRSLLVPMGCWLYGSVSDANLMVSRIPSYADCICCFPHFSVLFFFKAIANLMLIDYRYWVSGESHHVMSTNLNYGVAWANPFNVILTCFTITVELHAGYIGTYLFKHRYLVHQN